MKFAVLILLLICLVPVLLMAFDLSEAAKKERTRRLALAVSRDGRQARSFKDADLEIYHRLGEPSPASRGRRDPVIPSRDLLKERIYWQKERDSHQQELARLDARIRRLEWRLTELKARSKPGERLRSDANEQVLEDSLQSLREERKRLIESFHERARKAGALPGWLR